jgi:hypothetical protein
MHLYLSVEDENTGDFNVYRDIMFSEQPLDKDTRLSFIDDSKKIIGHEVDLPNGEVVEVSAALNTDTRSLFLHVVQNDKSLIYLFCVADLSINFFTDGEFEIRVSTHEFYRKLQRG